MAAVRTAPFRNTGSRQQNDFEAFISTERISLMKNNLVKDLSSPPRIKVLKVDDTSIVHNEGGFFELESCRIAFHYPSGEVKEAETNRLRGKRGDAVAIVLYEDLPEVGRVVWLRSCCRPAISLKNYREYGLPDSHEDGCLWEVPAGLVEEDEVGSEGLKRAAVREAEEEAGFSLKEEDFSFLGKRTFTSVGSMGERIFYLMAKVDWKLRKEPKGDGSPYEHGGEVIAIALEDAVAAIADGYLPDAKTEIAIKRLAEKVK